MAMAAWTTIEDLRAPSGSCPGASLDFRSTRGLLSFADGGFRKCCFRAITSRSAVGVAARRWKGRGTGVRSCSRDAFSARKTRRCLLRSGAAPWLQRQSNNSFQVWSTHMPTVTDKIDDQNRKKELTRFRPGDTVRVHVKIKEGEKERIQVFEGTVIAQRRGGSRSTF